VNSSQNSPGDEEAGEEDEGQEGGKLPLAPNRPPSEPPFRHPKNRSTPLRAFRSALRRRNARFPPRIPFPRRGFFGMPARIPRRRDPSRIAFASSAASAYTPFGRLRARPLPLFFTRRPPSASSNRRQSCSSSGPTAILKGSPSSFTQTRAFVPFRFFMPIHSYTFPPFFASTSVESTATASTFPFPSVSPQSRRACRIWRQIPFS